MPKDKKGFALLVAGKPTKGPPAEEDDYMGEEEPAADVAVDIEAEAPAEPEYPEFDIPEGLDLSDMEDGDEKEVLAVVRKKSDGTACVVSVDGVNLTGAEEVAPELPTEAPPGEAMPPAPVDIRSRAMGAGLM
jgi:hypothetical protein